LRRHEDGGSRESSEVRLLEESKDLVELCIAASEKERGDMSK